MTAAFMHDNQDNVLDLLGVGFGPANLAVSIALRESTYGGELRVGFVEQKLQFAWHPGMLIPGSRAQVPFMKDLVTLRDPTSSFSYLNWLHTTGLLFPFVTARDFTPFREELDAYFRWAASHFNDWVQYGARITAIRQAGVDAPPEAHGGIEADVFDLETGTSKRVYARGLVVASGGTPALPECVRGIDSPRVFHTNDFTRAVPTVAPDRHSPYSFVVVGAGQSAGDTAAELLQRYPECNVTMAFRGYAPRPLDESPFINEMFGPEAREVTLQMAEVSQDSFRANHHFANYSAVDAGLLNTLYRDRLRDAILGRERLHLRPYSNLVGVDASNRSVTAHWRQVNDGAASTTTCDAIVLATGYSRHLPLLDELGELVTRDSSGRLQVDRRYRVRTAPGLTAPVWVQGFAERSHGLSDTLLSLIAVRAGEIVEDLLNSRPVSARRG